MNKGREIQNERETGDKRCGNAEIQLEEKIFRAAKNYQMVRQEQKCRSGERSEKRNDEDGADADKKDKEVDEDKMTRKLQTATRNKG